MPELVEIKGVGPVLAAECAVAGFGSVEKIAGAKANELATVRGVGVVRAKSMISAAQSLLDSSSLATTAMPKNVKPEKNKKRKQNKNKDTKKTRNKKDKKKLKKKNQKK